MSLGTEKQLALLRSWWQFSAISQFLFTHLHVYCDDTYDVSILEQLIITKNEWVQDLNIRLFRLGTRNRFIVRGCWLGYLAQTLKLHNLSYFEFSPSLDYWDLSLRVRILILHFLCELQFDRLDSFRGLTGVSDEEARQWRVEPVGYHSSGKIYWYKFFLIERLFDDSRLYLERPIHLDHPATVPLNDKKSMKTVPENQNLHNFNYYNSTSQTNADVSLAEKSIPNINNITSSADDIEQNIIKSENKNQPDQFSDNNVIPLKNVKDANLEDVLNPNWKLLCYSVETWENVSTFCNKRTKNDAKIANYLENVAPLVIQDIQASEEIRKNKECFAQCLFDVTYDDVQEKESAQNDRPSEMTESEILEVVEKAEGRSLRLRKIDDLKPQQEQHVSRGSKIFYFYISETTRRTRKKN